MMTEENKNDIMQLDEINLFFLIDECGAYMHRMRHLIDKKMIDKLSLSSVESDLKTVAETQLFAADQLNKFGIDPETNKDSENGDYWKWYRHWNSWKNGMSAKDWQVVSNLVTDQKSIPEKYLPPTKWDQ